MLIVICQNSVCSRRLISFSVGLFCDLYHPKAHGVTPVIEYQNGKPYIKNIDVRVSLSHSYNVSVCAVSFNPVGIDIEKIKDRDYLKIAQRFFEREPTSLYDFYALWTAKESYKKLSDVPLISALKKTDYSNLKTFDFIKDYCLSVIGDDDIYISFFFE